MNINGFLLALCIWRESRGELLTTKQAVGWSIRNRVMKPGWWGHSWWSVILMPKQYSSFNHNDPNATKWPMENDPSWQEALSVAEDLSDMLPAFPDPTRGATHYFDVSLDTNPPAWAATMKWQCDWGRLHFYA